MKRFFACLALGACLTSPALAQERLEQHDYRVHHALFGDIGTLTHVIRSDGDDIRVSTRAEVRVRTLGVTLHHMTLAWDEAWRGGQLLEVRGTTIRNGNMMTVRAWTEGGHVTIATGEGTREAPVGLQPINPWSPQLAHAAALMSPETGKIVPLRLTDRGAESASKTAPGRPLQHYSMGANDFYFDESGTLVRSQYSDITGTVSFTLIGHGRQEIAQSAPPR